MKRTYLTVMVGLAAVLAFSGTVTAQAEEERIEEMVIVAHPLSAEGLSQASDVLEGEELDRKVAASIGATLAAETGIHSGSFGTAVGRPVIHGLAGPRVRIMEDRIDTLDVSVTSADHAVTVEPFLAERVEVLKGPSALLYGSGAIGGVVDVHTGRIPHEVPEKLTGGVEARYDDNSDGVATSLKLNGGAGSFAWHLDAAWRDGDDYEIPGFAESSGFRAAEEAEEEEHEEEEEEEEHEEEPEVRGRLPGSDYDFESYAGGVSVVQDWGFVGISVSQLDADYGLPGGHGHHEEEHHDEEEEEEEEEEHEEEVEGNPLLEMEQTRVDLEMGIVDPFGPFTSLNVRVGINDYEHQEIEPSGEVATDFSNEAWEARGELVYEGDAWSGALGMQLLDREFSAVGEEAFVQPVDTSEWGVFWVGERQFDQFGLELGARLGRVEHDPTDGSSESFNTWAASIGFVIPMGDNWQLGLTGDYSTRAPIGEELFANGPHIVTNAFEVGDPTLDEETAASIAGTLSYVGDRWNFSATVYYTQFSDFIYEAATGEEEDELPVFQFMQDDADFFGVDFEVSVLVAEWDGGSMSLNAMWDLVHADLDVSGNDNIPRLPPIRYGGGFEVRSGNLTFAVDYLTVDEQDDVTDFELATNDYEDLRVYAGAEFEMGGGSLHVFAQGRNLTDDEQRHHTSFIKDLVPAPGETVELGVRLEF